jgi:tRNA-dihydrouridine synthase
MKIGSVQLAYPFVVAPMAGMDMAFRRLVKRHGGSVSSSPRWSFGAGWSADRSDARIRGYRGRTTLHSSLAAIRQVAAAAQIVEGMGAMSST